jgi:hypothetical protein
MADHIPEQPTIVIPWWQDGSTTSEELKEPFFISKGVIAFFAMIKGWLLFPLNQSDALTCSESLLNVMAWDRDIARFKEEPLALFRLRVKYALINAKDAGSVAGFKAIFERLGIAIVSLKERESEAWDICTIELTDGDLSASSALVKSLVEQYGRTCRRYRFEVTYLATLNITGNKFPHNFTSFAALHVARVYPDTGILGHNTIGKSTLGL